MRDPQLVNKGEWIQALNDKGTKLDFSGKDLRGANLTDVCLCSEAVNLEGALLQGADLQNAQLMGSKLKSANLQGACLGNANLSAAGLEGCQLQGASFIGGHLQAAHLKDANLRGVDLEQANLSGADLRCSHLEGCRFYGARLDGVNLTGAKLSDANFTRAEWDMPPLCREIHVDPLPMPSFLRTRRERKITAALAQHFIRTEEDGSESEEGDEEASESLMTRKSWLKKDDVAQPGFGKRFLHSCG